MFGEVYSADPAITSTVRHPGPAAATLDFPFQDAARGYASQGGSRRRLADVLRRRLPVHRRGQADAVRAAHLPRQPRHGPDRLLPAQDNPAATDAASCCAGTGSPTS